MVFTLLVFSVAVLAYPPTWGWPVGGPNPVTPPKSGMASEPDMKAEPEASIPVIMAEEDGGMEGAVGVKVGGALNEAAVGGPVGGAGDELIPGGATYRPRFRPRAVAPPPCMTDPPLGPKPMGGGAIPPVGGPKPLVGGALAVGGPMEAEEGDFGRRKTPGGGGPNELREAELETVDREGVSTPGGRGEGVAGFKGGREDRLNESPSGPEAGSVAGGAAGGGAAAATGWVGGAMRAGVDTPPKESAREKLAPARSGLLRLWPEELFEGGCMICSCRVCLLLGSVSW